VLGRSTPGGQSGPCIRADDGFTGGTRFDVEYAASLGIPIQIHRESGLSQRIFQYSFPFFDEKKGLFVGMGRVFP